MEKEIITILFSLFSTIVPIILLATYNMEMKIVFFEWYIVYSIFLWIFLNRFYEIIGSDLLLTTTILSLTFSPIVAFLSINISKFLLLIPSILLEKYEFILLFIPSPMVLFLLLLYFIGTDIVFSPRMTKNWKVIGIVLTALVFNFINQEITRLFVLGIIISMMYKTLKRFEEYKESYLLIILLSSLLTWINKDFKLIDGIILVVTVSNFVKLQSLIERGWIRTDKILSNIMVNLKYLLIFFQAIYIYYNLIWGLIGVIILTEFTFLLQIPYKRIRRFIPL